MTVRPLTSLSMSSTVNRSRRRRGVLIGWNRGPMVVTKTSAARVAGGRSAIVWVSVFMPQLTVLPRSLVSIFSEPLPLPVGGEMKVRPLSAWLMLASGPVAVTLAVPLPTMVSRRGARAVQRRCPGGRQLHLDVARAGVDIGDGYGVAADRSRRPRRRVLGGRIDVRHGGDRGIVDGIRGQGEGQAGGRSSRRNRW